MRPISDRMLSATGQVRDVELAVPDDWRDLLWAFGLRLQAEQGQSFEALMHGSGIQSVLAYSVLQLLDTSFRSSFGWKKGAIWAVEEPESFLHADLQASLARSFSEYAAATTPLQIFLTTHSSAFLGTADHGVTVGMRGQMSDVAVVTRESLIKEAYGTGTTPFGHPLHAGPLKPLLVTEGKDDRALIAQAYAYSNEPCPYEIVCLEDLEPSLTGGVDQIVTYLNHNRSALAARPAASPVVVLVDWEVNDAKLRELGRALEHHPTSVAERLPPDARNQDLSPHFVGIEGFLATGFVETLAEEGHLSLSTPGPGAARPWRYAVDRAELRAAKTAIHRRLRERSDSTDIGPLLSQVPFISRLLARQQPLPVLP
jgi:hypothetical protein